MRERVKSEVGVRNRPTILLVDDDDDIRDLLATLLQIAGFAPKPCRTAEEGLQNLREQQFDLVLTDYMLPHRSGTWLLEQASNEGLLDATPALVVTAHPNPLDVERYEVISKPFDHDELVDRIKRQLEGGDGSPKQLRGRKANPSRRNGGDHDDCPDPIELILYVSAHSPRSATAIEAIKKQLRRYKSSRVKLTIYDLSKSQGMAEPDGVAMAPTVARRSPGPRTYILGHITNPALLLELLETCEGH